MQDVKLPGSHLAVVEKEKILDYILNETHPDNGGKAAFFFEIGFTRDDWQNMLIALQRLALTAKVSGKIDSQHGIKYILDGRITSPSGKKPVVRSIWIVDRDQSTPRLVTVYPHEE